MTLDATDQGSEIRDQGSGGGSARDAYSEAFAARVPSPEVPNPTDAPSQVPGRCGEQADDLPPATGDLSDILRQYVDVTARLQQTHQTLQRELLRLRQELASKDRELELRRRLASLGELAAGVAHEVRNPLGAIQLYSGLLRRECSAVRLESALRLLDKIEAGIHAIEAVVQDTLALAPRAGSLRGCPLAAVLERVREATLATLSQHGVRLEIQLEDEAACVQADEEGLRRVLVNLVVNAAEASRAGQVVRVEAGRPIDGEVTVRVLDQGCGLAEEIQHRIYDPFFTTKTQGTGLGLTIAHRLVEAYGGRLSASNRPEGGAVFLIRLPQGSVAPAPGRCAGEEAACPRQFTAA